MKKILTTFGLAIAVIVIVYISIVISAFSIFGTLTILFLGEVTICLALLIWLIFHNVSLTKTINKVILGGLILISLGIILSIGGFMEFKSQFGRTMVNSQTGLVEEYIPKAEHDFAIYFRHNPFQYRVYRLNAELLPMVRCIETTRDLNKSLSSTNTDQIKFCVELDTEVLASKLQPGANWAQIQTEIEDWNRWAADASVLEGVWKSPDKIAFLNNLRLPNGLYEVKSIEIWHEKHSVTKGSQH